MTYLYKGIDYFRANFVYNIKHIYSKYFISKVLFSQVQLIYYQLSLIAKYFYIW